MNKKSKLALAGTVFAASAIAIACTVVQEPFFDINIGGVSSPDDVGKVVQEALGGVYGPDVDVNGIVRYSVGWVYFPGFPGMPGDCWGDCGGTVEVGDLEQA